MPGSLEFDVTRVTLPVARPLAELPVFLVASNMKAGLQGW